MTDPTRIQVQVLRRFDAPPQKIYDAFMDAKQAGKFMFATEDGEIIKAEVEPRVGGTFVFVDRREQGDAEHYGTFTELERPKKIAFTFAVAKDAKDKDPVSIAISPKGKGSEVVLTHEVSAAYKAYRDRIADGWQTMLSGLARTVGM